LILKFLKRLLTNSAEFDTFLQAWGQIGCFVSQEKETVLLKISGESLSGEGGYGLTRSPLEFIGEEVVSVSHTHQLAIVVGGGNIIRGAKLKQEVFRKDVASADYMGMLSTMINALALQAFLENEYGLDTRVMSALEARQVCEPYIVRRALSHLEKGRIVICAGGIGTPNFSTDITMVIRANEIGAKIALKGTKVDGIYDKDPKQHADAKFLEEISYLDYLNQKLSIVDATAVAQAMNHGITIRVFNFLTKGNLRRVLIDKNIGSVIH